MERFSRGLLGSLKRLSSFDALYRTWLVKPAETFAASLAVIDKGVIDSGLSRIFQGLRLLAKAVTRLQSGYAFTMFVSMVVLILMAIAGMSARS